MRSKLAGNIARHITAAVISILVIVYIIYHLVVSFGTSLETVPAQLVTVNETLTVEAYILRDETVLSSTNPGGINCLYQDGAMVRKSSAVANVYSGADLSVTQGRIAEIDDQIRILQESGVTENAALSDSSALSGSIDEVYYGVLEKVNQGNVDYAFRRRTELLTLMNKRMVAQGIVVDYSANIAELQRRRDQLTASLTNISETVTTPASGYFYSEVDGYENAFSAENIDTLTVDSFKQMVETQPTDYGSNVVGKVATDYKWYIACVISSDEAHSFAEDRKYTVIYPYSSDAEVPMTLYRAVTDETSGETLLIFSTGNVDANFNFLRRQTVDIVIASYTGYKVPVSSVRIVDGKEGVYVLNGNVVEFRTVDPMVEIDGNLIVRERNSDFVPVDGDDDARLGFYELIITKGKDIHEGKVVG